MRKCDELGALMPYILCLEFISKIMCVVLEYNSGITSTAFAHEVCSYSGLKVMLQLPASMMTTNKHAHTHIRINTMGDALRQQYNWPILFRGHGHMDISHTHTVMMFHAPAHIHYSTRRAYVCMIIAEPRNVVIDIFAGRV